MLSHMLCHVCGIFCIIFCVTYVYCFISMSYFCNICVILCHILCHIILTSGVQYLIVVLLVSLLYYWLLFEKRVSVAHFIRAVKRQSRNIYLATDKFWIVLSNLPELNFCKSFVRISWFEISFLGCFSNYLSVQIQILSFMMEKCLIAGRKASASQPSSSPPWPS